MIKLKLKPLIQILLLPAGKRSTIPSPTRPPVLISSTSSCSGKQLAFSTVMPIFSLRPPDRVMPLIMLSIQSTKF